MMDTAVPLSIPRWQWRTFGDDLSWLTRRLPASQTGAIRCDVETHLVCDRSTHHAWVRGGQLELRWRKETAPEGFELWDTILRASAPFTSGDLARLYAAWGLQPPPALAAPNAAAGFERTIAATPSVHPVHVTRSCQAVLVHGVPCSLESLAVESGAHVQSFCVEHEDPSIIAQLLADVGLDAHANTNFLQGLRQALEYAARRS